MQWRMTNRPFPSSTQPPFQSEAKCELCYENQFLFILKLELITITKISHLDSLWKRDWMKTRKWPISLVFASKPLTTVVTAILVINTGVVTPTLSCELTKFRAVFSYIVAICSQPKCSIQATRAKFRADSDGSARKRVGNFFLFDNARDLDAYDIWREQKTLSIVH